jgi:hypothetical protein
MSAYLISLSLAGLTAIAVWEPLMSAKIIQFAPRPHRERRAMEFSTIASRSVPQPDDLTMDHVDTSPCEYVWPDSRERQISDG